MAPPTKGSHHTDRLGDVFVLGAGVSVPYGFPTGAGLLKGMRSETFKFRDVELMDILGTVMGRRLFPPYEQQDYMARSWEHSGEKRLCEGWSRVVRGSVILTIDQFLKNLDDDRMRGFGKRLMARQILNAEQKACEQPRSEKGDEGRASMHSLDWIQEFLTSVDRLSNWQEYLASTVFLTFNYDRVLEFFLERYLVVDKNWQITAARKFIEEEMSILHLNGHIGSLGQVPFGNLVGEENGFDPLFDSHSKQVPSIDWTAVAKRMRTVWEDPEHHPDAAEIQKHAKLATSEAKRVFVIGTSFIPENFEAIGLCGSESSPKRRAGIGLACTTYSLSPAQVLRAADMLCNGVRMQDHFFDKTARDFDVDHVVL